MRKQKLGYSELLVTVGTVHKLRNAKMLPVTCHAKIYETSKNVYVMLAIYPLTPFLRYVIYERPIILQNINFYCLIDCGLNWIFIEDIRKSITSKTMKPLRHYYRALKLKMSRRF